MATAARKTFRIRKATKQVAAKAVGVQNAPVEVTKIINKYRCVWCFTEKVSLSAKCPRCHKMAGTTLPMSAFKTVYIEQDEL